MRFFCLVMIAGFGLASSGCLSPGSGDGGQSIPAPHPSRRDELPADAVEKARELYVAKCARCHRFYHPAQYATAEWSTWMQKMSRKAKLTPDQEQLLSRYLETFRPAD